MPDLRTLHLRVVQFCLFAVLCSVGETFADAKNPTDRRHVQLAGQSNFRDVGGYRTSNGKQVVLGLIYRSGVLGKLSDGDVDQLKQIGIATDVNFLTADEIKAAGADRLPAGAREVALPIETDDGLAGAILQARKTADFSNVPVELNPKLHRMLVEQAKQQYAALFREILRTEKPLVFHCSHGVHRTGTAAALLLWSLGVPWETVRNDYLLSNRYRQAEVAKRLQQLRALAAKNRQIPVADVDMTNIKAFYVLQGAYIDASRDEVLKRYGSIDRYLTEGLGLTRQETRQLREKLVR